MLSVGSSILGLAGDAHTSGADADAAPREDAADGRGRAAVGCEVRAEVQRAPSDGVRVWRHAPAHTDAAEGRSCAIAIQGPSAARRTSSRFAGCSLHGTTCQCQYRAMQCSHMYVEGRWTPTWSRWPMSAWFLTAALLGSALCTVPSAQARTLGSAPGSQDYRTAGSMYKGVRMRTTQYTLTMTSILMLILIIIIVLIITLRPVVDIATLDERLSGAGAPAGGRRGCTNGRCVMHCKWSNNHSCIDRTWQRYLTVTDSI